MHLISFKFLSYEFFSFITVTLSLSVLLMEHLLMFSKTYGILQMQMLSSVCYNFGKLIGEKVIYSIRFLSGFFFLYKESKMH